MTTATHYSNTTGLTVLDPAFYGANTSGKEKSRRAAYPKLWVNRSYVGLPGYEKEACLGRYEYTAQIDESRLYDLGTDVQGYFAQAIRECRKSGSYGIADRQAWITAAERLVRDAGWLGYFTETLKGAVALFEPVALTAA